MIDHRALLSNRCSLQRSPITSLSVGATPTRHPRYIISPLVAHKTKFRGRAKIYAGQPERWNELAHVSLPSFLSFSRVSCRVRRRNHSSRSWMNSLSLGPSTSFRQKSFRPGTSQRLFQLFQFLSFSFYFLTFTSSFLLDRIISRESLCICGKFLNMKLDVTRR